VRQGAGSIRIFTDDFSAGAARDAGLTVIQTTLYDLIDAIGEAVELEERALIPDIVVHVLRAHRVTCPGVSPPLGVGLYYAVVVKSTMEARRYPMKPGNAIRAL
jgi:hypothetical protein